MDGEGRRGRPRPQLPRTAGGTLPGGAGCRFYQPCQDPESPGTFLIFEIYDDQAAYEAHGASEHFQQIGAGEAFPLLENRERSFFETL